MEKEKIKDDLKKSKQVEKVKKQKINDEFKKTK